MKNIFLKSIQKSVSIIKRPFIKANKNALFIFGNQKSGTTVIAALLAKATNKSVLLDLPLNKSYKDYIKKLYTDDINIHQFVKFYKQEFSKNIIKEPALTLLYKHLCEFFNIKNPVFIVRDPRDNIRSILNRLKLNGDSNNIENFEKLPIPWQRIIGNDLDSHNGNDYIRKLSERWNHFIEIYLESQDDFLLCKYEDFMVNKEQYIYSLCKTLNYEIINSIKMDVNKQYQPKGNSQVDLKSFFGEKNFAIIESVCGDNMQKLGYI